MSTLQGQAEPTVSRFKMSLSAAPTPIPMFPGSVKTKRTKQTNQNSLSWADFCLLDFTSGCVYWRQGLHTSGQTTWHLEVSAELPPIPGLNPICYMCQGSVCLDPHQTPGGREKRVSADRTRRRHNNTVRALCVNLFHSTTQNHLYDTWG